MNSTEMEITREEVQAFRDRYDYDTAYMEEMLDVSPEAFARFWAASPMTAFRENLPVVEHHVVRLAAMQRADCGPCLELTIKLAREDEVDVATIRGVLHDGEGLPPELEQLRRYAGAVAGGESPDEADREALRARHGTAALHEIGLNVAGTLLYPTIKRATGHAQGCALTPPSI